MRLAGCSIVSHAVRLDFPIVPAVRSLLAVCDEVVVNVGPPDDGTHDLLQGLREPRLRLLRGEWDPSLGGRVLAVETNRALAAVQGDWAIYLQADEVLHEADTPRLREAIAAADPDPSVEGLLFDYLHFYGSFRRLATNRTWIRHEVRAIRPGGAVQSFAEAQGFRVMPAGRRVRARGTGCRVFHYGWARPLAALQAKREIDHAIYHATDGVPMRAQLPGRMPGEIGLAEYDGPHPQVAEAWIAAREGLLPPDVLPVRWSARQAQIALLHGLERVTGWRPFEFRNYTKV
jgi:hypothetical protein